MVNEKERLRKKNICSYKQTRRHHILQHHSAAAPQAIEFSWIASGLVDYADAEAQT